MGHCAGKGRREQKHLTRAFPFRGEREKAGGGRDRRWTRRPNMATTSQISFKIADDGKLMGKDMHARWICDDVLYYN